MHSGRRKPRMPPLAFTRGLIAVSRAVIDARTGLDESVLHVCEIRDRRSGGRITAQRGSVTIFFGAAGQAVSTRLKKRFAAALSRRFCSRMSGSIPCRSTARDSS